MQNFTTSPYWKSAPGFALISVLALVSLAALTATAFLASARLERQASSSIGKTTLVEMALDSGKYCVGQVINDYSKADLGNCHIVTYWRTNITNEIGYPFIGKIKTSGNNNGQASAMWYYAPLFSPAGVTNLDTNDIQKAMRFTNNHQGTFSFDMQTFMSNNATNGFTNTPGLNHPKCVQIPLLGGRISPPVGWVYIDHEKRKPGLTNTYTSPVLRIAWFTEDLEGLIDSQRMGAFINRSTGTNSEEVSLSSAKDTNTPPLPLISSISSFTNQTNRKAYLSYGLLATPSISGLANSTNARYFATGLRSWSPTDPASPTNGAVEWIPMGIPIRVTNNVAIGYTNQGYTKINLNSMATNPNALANIAYVITNNLPNFTNRAGGMNGTNYALALAANIIDYADADSSATITNIGTTTAVTNVVGFDSYPFVTQIFDQFICNLNGNNVGITVNTYLQFWNPSSVSTPATTYTVLYDFADRVRNIVYTNTSGTITNSNTVNFTMFPTVSTHTNSAGTAHSFSNDITLPQLAPNQGTIVSFQHVYSLAISPPANQVFHQIWINGVSGSTQINPFTIRLGTNDLIRPKNSFYRSAISLTNGQTNWLGAIPGLRYGASAIGTAAQSRLCADPRMLNYLTSNPTTNGSAVDYPNAYWQGYPSEFTSDLISGQPGNWPDGYNTANNPPPIRGIKNPTVPTVGTFTIQDPLTLIADPAPCKISNVGSYTNILELGNIFDPIQWAPPATPIITNYANVDITTTWTTNSIYGGGSTLRIGRAEHSRFAFTNLPAGAGANPLPIPNMGMSAAALLDLFCITNLTKAYPEGPYSMGAGRINLNTAPAPVLAALAGGIDLIRDPNKVGTADKNQMIYAFTNGVMKFRQLYPFLSPSQLAFISENYGTTSPPSMHWTNTFSNNAVFSSTVKAGLNGVASINDEGLEEWFSKIYHLSSCQSYNYRIYVVAQLVSTNSKGQTNAIGPLVKKYYQVYFQNGSSVTPPGPTSKWPATNSTYQTNNNIYTWVPEGYPIDIYESSY